MRVNNNNQSKLWSGSSVKIYNYIIAPTLALICLSCQGQRAVPFTKNEDIQEPCYEEPLELGVWNDINQDGLGAESEFLGKIKEYEGGLPMDLNYGYESASAHPVVGPQPADYEAHIFFYRGPDGLGFNFFFNRDQNGSDFNEVNWSIKTSGNSSKDSVLVSDDHVELHEKEASSGGITYEGLFRYSKNTDGGVIGPFVGNDFKIIVNSIGSGDIRSAGFYSADSTRINLIDQGPILSFIVQPMKSSQCISDED